MVSPQPERNDNVMNPKISIHPKAPSLVAQIVGLSELPMADIKSLWIDLFGSPPTTHGRTFLERRIAYKLQENALRKTNPELLEQNAQRIQALMEAQTFTPAAKGTIAAGTVLIREYQGNEYKVVVRADGQFDFNGQTYGSLSVIARTITGTRWSGPLFFGLRDGDKSAKKGGKQ